MKNGNIFLSFVVTFCAICMVPATSYSGSVIKKKLSKNEYSPTGTLYVNAESAWIIKKTSNEDLVTMRQYVGPNDVDNLASSAGSLCLYQSEIPSEVKKVYLAALYPNNKKAVVVFGDRNLPAMLCAAKPEELKRILRGNRKTVEAKDLPTQPE
jgi:hypothetical protein